MFKPDTSNAEFSSLYSVDKDNIKLFNIQGLNAGRNCDWEYFKVTPAPKTDSQTRNGFKETLPERENTSFVSPST